MKIGMRLEMNPPNKVLNYKNIFTYFILIVPFILLILATPEDWFGVVLIFLILIYIFTQKVFVENINTMVAMLVVFFLKVTISLINNNFFTIYGAGADAIGFFKNASFISQYNTGIDLINTGSELYTNYLALVFNFIGVSKFSGEMLSIFAFVLSVRYLLKIAEKLYGSTYNTPLVYLFGLLPSMLIYTSITMREPYQILFFLMSIYYFIKAIESNKFSFILFIKFIISIFILGMLHNGLLVFTFAILIIYFNKILTTNLRVKNLLIKVILSGIALVLFIGLLNIVGISTQASDAILKGDITSYIDDYRDGGIALDSRAQYGVELNTSNIFTVVLTAPVVFISYMIAPFPWQISSVLDIYAMIENIFRLILLFAAINYLRKNEEIKKTSLYQVMILFILMELLWSLGTVNWGTAVRHHLIGYGLILILAMPVFVKAIIRSIQKFT
ncbi:hypothetical protein J2Z83_001299 [Virgibacillus natechei]|uniref:Glycosyltransferase RgtA/B/C/D-like domain-containing protein n=1 Tax=Virgibacillus natechei TaxID=1216297 RepID=A0ABS4IE65_9BACI|nr:hypothetical protein [Virgibacillus natechei]MBP1969195.1 hypothetical protein [Virgibacillus natechei]UZD12361.1 hypothetical protein OLD84_15820 [Virgibacillus natechei]